MDEPAVECYAGVRHPERPRAFTWHGERLRVEQVEREWRTPEGLVFRIRTPDGRRFTLSYREADTAWQIEALGRARPQPK